jgi:membrane fusion protein, multidrug efflux system
MRLLSALLPSIVICATACGGGGGPAPAGNANEAPVIQLAAEDVVVVRRGTIATGPRVTGTLEARERAVVRAEVGGAVVDVGPELGEAVKKGDLLVRIEAKAAGETVRSAEAGVTSAQASLDLARREVERTEALVKGGALAQRELDRAKSAERTATAALAQARAGASGARVSFGDALMRSPITGVVAQRTVNRGDIATVGGLLYEIIVPSTMRLSASVSSEDLGAVALGKPVSFEVRGYPGQRFEGTIARIAPAADAATRQIPILVDLPNPGGKLIAGLYAEGRIAADEKQALLLPLAAIDTSGERPTVLRANNGIAERVAIATGLRDERNEMVEVTSGVGAGDIVILERAARTIGAGVKVAPPPQQTAAEKVEKR